MKKIFIIFAIIIFSVIIISMLIRNPLEKSINELFLFSQNISNRVYTFDAIKGLPEPVSQYFKYALREGQPYISSVRLKHNGTFRLKPEQKWLQIKGEEYFSLNKIGFVWFGKLSLFSAIDQYIKSEGRLIVKFLSIIKVVDAKGEKINQGELLRWLGEAVWYPTALLPSEYLRWQAIDRYSARVTLTNNGISVDGVFYFNNLGQISRFSAKRYKENSLENWTGYYRNYKEVDGIKIPHEVEVVWNLKSGDFSYAKFYLNRIEYNKPYSFRSK